MTKIIRCQCKNLINGKRCLRRSQMKYHFENKYYCLQHYQIISNKYALMIQKIFRGFKHRKLVNKIYKNLPDDIQYKILNFVRQDYYYKKYKNRLNIIIANRIYKFELCHFQSPYYIGQVEYKVNFCIDYIVNNLQMIKKLAYFYEKYYSILDIYIKKDFKEIVREISVKVNQYEFIINNASMSHKFDIVYNLFFKLDVLVNPSTTLSSEFYFNYNND